jgi:outer membrane biosynthesis protein TonB
MARLVCSLFVLMALACGGGGNSNYRIPTGDAVQPFVAPEEEEITGEEAAGGDAEEGWEDEGDDDEATPKKDDKQEPAPTAEAEVNLEGDGLTRDQIKAVVTKARAKVQYCYEKELLKDPSLQGTVTVEFVIRANGGVGVSKASGMAKIDSCVADVFKALKFPRPKGGGAVSVRYPYVLKTADGSASAGAASKKGGDKPKPEKAGN